MFPVEYHAATLKNVAELCGVISETLFLRDNKHFILTHLIWSHLSRKIRRKMIIGICTHIPIFKCMGKDLELFLFSFLHFPSMWFLPEYFCLEAIRRSQAKQMPVAVEWAIWPRARCRTPGTHKGPLAWAECQMLSEVRRAPTRGLGDQSHSEMRTIVM